MSLAITGAAGQLGGRTAELLLERVDPAEVVLVSRSPEKLAGFAERGVATRAGDFDQPDTLEAAFSGVERLLIVSTDKIEGRAEQQRHAVAAAAAAGVAQIIYTSLPAPDAENPAIPAESHRDTEAAITASGLAWTFLRNELYSEFRLPDLQVAAQSGHFYHDWGSGETAFVAREDCAAVAAAVLADATAHENVAYDITGPELIGAERLAAIYAQVAGRPVQSINLSPEDWAAGMRAAGLADEMITMVGSFGAAIRAGKLNQVNDVVPRLTGRPATSVETVLATAFARA